MKLSDIENFSFYTEEYPIIKDPGWQAGVFSYGSLWFLYHEVLSGVPFASDPRYRAFILGIIVRPSSWNYCWKAEMNGHMNGGPLDIENDAPHSDVYAAAKRKAIEYVTYSYADLSDTA